MNDLEEIYAALQIIFARLDTLASIPASNMLIPGGPQARYHEIVEEAGAALGQVETVVDMLREQLEYEHRRLDEARDAVRQEATTYLQGYGHDYFRRFDDQARC